MKKKVFNIIAAALFLAACDMKTEIDVDIAAFPPRLVVTATLDGGSGTFSIILTEGRALADFKTPRPSGQKVVANGEIRLYEDGNLILREAGEFDMTTNNFEPYFCRDTWQFIFPERGGYRFEAPVATNPGSTYRLVVMTDKHETVTSTSTMPPLPVVSVSINTTETIKRGGVKRYSSLGRGISVSGGGSFEFWAVSLQWGERPAGRNYYALEMHEERTLVEGTPNEWDREGKFYIGIYVPDLSKLQDNPEVEIFDAMEIDLGGGPTINYDTYWFPILLMSDMAFTSDDASITLLKHTPWSGFDFRSSVENSQQNPHPSFPSNFPRFEVTYTLRVRHITEATFRYYRSLALQSIGLDFFTEPVNIVSNIENGFGVFTVFSAADFRLSE